MKSSILRTGIALACAVSLASCGGGNTGTLYLAGTVTGVTLDGLTLQNNGGADLVIPANATTFQFKDLVPSDSIYNVTIKKDASGKEIYPANVQSCSVTSGSGNTGLYSVASVKVACIIFTHKLGGTVTGLGTSTDLVLVNGPDQVKVQPAPDGGTTTFQMAPVSQNYPYGITVLAQPAGKTCTVTNGVGTLGLVDYQGVNVACTPTAGA
ncbi:MAG: hypothetical protein M3Y65_20860 [Pseudomonadota bacterium]|nr:hypothetical protein [Pseudomonadota bacterium]